MYNKDFDGWNKVKKGVDKVSDAPHFRVRDVWWVSVGVNVGCETDGKNDNFERPVVVVRKFNNEQFWGIPLTSKEKRGKYFVKVQHEKGYSYANTSQMKVLSNKRLLRKIGMIGGADFSMIKELLKSSF